MTTTTNPSSVGLDASMSSLNSLDNETSATSSANIDTQPSKWNSTNTSLTASPLASRDSSPTRPSARTTRTSRSSASVSSTNVSRKSSAQDLGSTPKARSGIPTPTASTPRQNLSSKTTPSLPPPPATETPRRASGPKKSASTGPEGNNKDSPRWPVSPRLKSPPPSLNRVSTTSQKADSEPPLINVQRATPSPQVESISQPPSSQPPSDTESEDQAAQSGTRTPARSTNSSMLETVQEVSQPNTPGPGLDAAMQKLEATAAAQSSSQPPMADPPVYKTPRTTQNSQNNSESGSESGSIKTSTRRSSSAAPAPLLHTRQSSTGLKYGTQRGQTESSSRNMTVETEQVSNMQKMSLAPNPGPQGATATLRPKASTETIKPRKEKKKPARKAAAVAGAASSKADVFEAKVASAVEEANSSDSDETFVYDSNPPEAVERPRPYHHSRTPSATSMMSQPNGNGMRSIHSVLEPGSTSNAHPKRNMKFVNTFNGSGVDSPVLDEDGRGTGRSHGGSGRGTSRHHHIGRWGRNPGNTHTSLFDNESPFPSATRPKFPGNTSRPPSNPPSPRVSAARHWASNTKRPLPATNAYDMDESGTRADDERTPLLLNGSIRSARSARPRRGQMMRNLEGQAYRQRPTFLNRFASCLVLTVMLLLVITGAIGFMFATSQPLTDIQLVKIGNVLASEQELMMDIQVRAHNPNVVVVTVDSANIELFAKSPNAGTDSEWWRHPDGPDDDFNIKEAPPADDAPNMRLGNVLELDSPLTYEGSFFQSGVSSSTGSLRLARPGNGTDGGSERWERILSDDFTLLLKGVLKYSLPLSQRVRSVAISGKTTVKPNSANDPVLEPPNSTVIGISR